MQEYKRTKLVESKNGGLDCLGNFQNTERCYLQECPVQVECQWSRWTKHGSCSRLVTDTHGGIYAFHLQKSFSQKLNAKPGFLYRNCQKWTKNCRKVSKTSKNFHFHSFSDKIGPKTTT